MRRLNENGIDLKNGVTMHVDSACGLFKHARLEVDTKNEAVIRNIKRALRSLEDDIGGLISAQRAWKGYINSSKRSNQHVEMPEVLRVRDELSRLENSKDNAHILEEVKRLRDSISGDPKLEKVKEGLKMLRHAYKYGSTFDVEAYVKMRENQASEVINRRK